MFNRFALPGFLESPTPEAQRNPRSVSGGGEAQRRGVMISGLYTKTMFNLSLRACEAISGPSPCAAIASLLSLQPLGSTRHAAQVERCPGTHSAALSLVPARVLRACEAISNSNFERIFPWDTLT